MPQPILCLDFDGVIHSYTSGWKGARNIPDPPVPGAIAFMEKALNAGFDVVIHSSRCRYWGGKRAIRRWLERESGNAWDGPFMGICMVRVVSMKPPAMVTLDDRALTFEGTWPDLNALRDFKPWNKRGS